MPVDLVAIVSVLGILGMTFLFPLLAVIMSPSWRRTSAASPQPESISILIPAHNEEALLPATLGSIADAIMEAKGSSPCTFRVLVGADGCTDKTEDKAVHMGAEVISMPAQIGKWATISTLVTHCQNSQWAILADCGVTWPRDFLVRLLPLLIRDSIIGVAPTYRNDTSGFVEKLVWGTERAIKTIESKCGGPVSVHGATVCYRTQELTSTLQFLSDRHWLNDDVVIPLCLRALHPIKKIAYASHLTVNEYTDTGCSPSREFVRRRRLVHGNIQWIRYLWGTVWEHNHVAAILASRRVFRLLWGYWAVFAALSLALYGNLFSLPSPQLLCLLLPLTVLILCVKQFRTLLESCLASILAPYYFVATLVRPSKSPYETQWN